MNCSRFLVIASILGLVFGLAFFLAPAQLMSFCGVTLDSAGPWIGRFLGAQLVGLAVITWVARNAPAGGAMICAFLAFGFTIATLFAYDRLNMPAEFWGGGGKPDATPRQWRINRPPSSYQLILFYEMIHVWKCFFTPAIVFATLSLGLLVVKLAYRHFVWPDAGAGTMAIIMLGIILLGLIVSMVIYKAYKPKLGFDD